MKFTVWGARGSTPVSGPEYVRYGGDTTCASVETSSGAIIVLDAGTGLRALGNRLVAEGRTEIHFLLTHAHWDHLMGFPFFKPIYRPGTTIWFHGCACAQHSLQGILAVTMRPPFFPVDLAHVAARLEYSEDCRTHYEIADIHCDSFPISHPDGGFGFRLRDKSRSLCFFPDSDPWFPHDKAPSLPDYIDFLRGTDLLVHDGEYLPEEYASFSKGWGPGLSEHGRPGPRRTRRTTAPVAPQPGPRR